MVGCGHSLECWGGGGEGFGEWITHLELSRAGMTVPYVYPQEVRRYCGRYNGTTPCTLRRYGGTTPVPSKVRRYHPCTFRRYDGTTLVPGGGTLVKFLSFFILTSHLGRCLVQVQGWYRCTSCRYKGGTVVPRAGTRVVPSYLLEVHYPFCSAEYMQFYQTTWGGRQQFSCKF